VWQDQSNRGFAQTNADHPEIVGGWAKKMLLEENALRVHLKTPDLSA
jgi:hypothetical protein